MGNFTKDTLHELIRHLSKSEKRYFKVYSSKHIIGEENNYNILFDFISNQEEYVEEEIFQHFKGEMFLNNFSIVKKRLYDYIISALDNFYSSKSIDSQIYKLINGASILYKKSLYHQSLKELKSAEKIAKKHEKFNLLAEINFKLKQIYESQGQLEMTMIDEMFQKDQEYHKKSLVFDQLWNFKSQLFGLLTSRGNSKTMEEIKQIKQKMDDFCLNIQEKDWYFATRFLFNHIYSAYYFAINSYEICDTYLNKNLTLIEQNEFALKEKPNQYLSVLTNAIYVSYLLKKEKELKILQEKLKSLKQNEIFTSNEDLQIKLFSSYYSLEITLLLLQGNWKEAEKLIPEIELAFQKYKDKITDIRKAFLYFKIATIYMYKSEFHLALKTINKVLQNTNLDNQEELMSTAHLVNLLIHFELNRDSNFQYVLKNTQRYLKSRNRLHDFESIFLKFITKITKTSQLILEEEIWENLHNELVKLNDSNLQKVNFELFDFYSWTKAKANRTSVINLYDKKSKVLGF